MPDKPFYRLCRAYLPLLLVTLTACDAVDLPAATKVNIDSYPPHIRLQLANALKAVDARPRKAAANGQLAMLLHTYDQLESADVYYQRAALLDTGDFRWPYLRALTRAALGDLDDALAQLRRAIAIDPGYPRAQIRLAELLLASGRQDETIDVLDKLGRDYPGGAEAYFIRARLALRLRDPQAAIAALEKVQSISGNFGALHQAFAQAYRQIGNEAETLKHSQLAEQYHDTRADIADPVMTSVLALNLSTTKRLERARGFASHGNLQRAREILDRALADDPDSLPVHVTLAGLYAGSGDFGRADQHLEIANSIDPQHPQLYYSTGVARLAEQRFTEAKQAFARALELDPDNADTRVQLGLAQEMSGQTDRAIENYRGALEINRWHRQANWLLGRQLLLAGRPGEAIGHLEPLRAARDPSSASILLDLARAYQASGSEEDALGVLREAIAIAKQFGDKRSGLAARGLLRRLELQQ